MTFDEWWSELRKIARKAKLSCLLSDKEDHRDSYEDGLTPREEMQELYEDVDCPTHVQIGYRIEKI